MLERRLHRQKILRLSFQLQDVCLSDRPHLPARTRMVVPQADEFTDLHDREAEVARMADESQGMHVAARVLAIARFGPVGRRVQPHRFVVANHLRRDTRRLRRLADVHRLHVISHCAGAISPRPLAAARKETPYRLTFQ